MIFFPLRARRPIRHFSTVNFLAANTILLMGKWNHACSLFVYVISVINPGRQRVLTAFRRYYLLKHKLRDRRSIICLSLRLRQIIDLLATDKSRYSAQPRPIIANYCALSVFPLFADTYDCDPYPCLNNGTCTDMVNNYTCACQPGFEGRNCSISKFIKSRI